MVFHVRWIFLTTSLYPTRHFFAHTLPCYTSMYVNHCAKLKIMKPCEMDLSHNMGESWKYARNFMDLGLYPQSKVLPWPSDGNCQHGHI